MDIDPLRQTGGRRTLEQHNNVQALSTLCGSGNGSKDSQATGRPEDATLGGLLVSRVPAMLAPKMEAWLDLFLEYSLGLSKRPRCCARFATRGSQIEASTEGLGEDGRRRRVSGKR